MAKAHYNTVVGQTCGVGVSGVFRKNVNSTGTPIANLTNSGGAGWHIASFTNDPQQVAAYKEAYKELRDKWQIVFQGKVRINTRTGFKFLVVLYDTKKKNVDNSEYEWPTSLGV
jgi:hypothetical protein